MDASQNPKREATLLRAVSIEHYDSINGTDGVLLYHKGAVALMEAGLMRADLHVGWDHPCFVAYEYGAGAPAVGVMIYWHDKPRRHYYVQMGYVLPQHRGNGHYRRMWDGLVAKASEAKVPEIRSATHVDNSQSIAMSAAFGRRNDSLAYTFPVPGVA